MALVVEEPAVALAVEEPAVVPVAVPAVAQAAVPVTVGRNSHSPGRAAVWAQTSDPDVD